MRTDPVFKPHTRGVVAAPRGVGQRWISSAGLVIAWLAVGCGSDSAAGTTPPATGMAPTTATPTPPMSASAAAGAGATPARPQPAAMTPSAPPVAPAAPPVAAPMAPAMMPPGQEQPALPAPTSDAPNPSPGCSGGSSQPGRTTHMIDVGGRMRDYVLYFPPGYTGSEPLPVLFLLHGGASDAANAESSSSIRPVADSENFIYIAPNAIGGLWEAENDTDELFFRAALDKLGADACIDTRRVYSTGCSMGGAMSFWLACNAADIIAAVAPLCGTAFFDLETACMPSRPISVMHSIGAQDTLNCWEGEPSGSQPGQQCTKGVLTAFQRINECKGEIQPSYDGVCETVGECAGGTEVTICNLNIGHIIWPAPDMDVPLEHWKFMRRFHLP
jgi:polyhydroxybutyrate depolymerase